MDLTSLLSREGRNPQTIKQYLSVLQRLHKRVTGAAEMQDLSWLVDHGKVLEALQIYKPASRKLYLVPILALLEKGENVDLRAKYQKEFTHAMHEVTKSKRTKTVEEAPEVVPEEAQDKEPERDLDKETKRIFKKTALGVTDEDKNTIMQALASKLLQEVDVGDKIGLPIYRLGVSDKQTSGNSCIEETILKFAIVVRKRGHQQTTPLSRQLNKLIGDSLKAFPRRFLLASPKDGDRPMTGAALAKCLAPILGKHVATPTEAREVLIGT
jgi:hypothetical protein